MNRKKQSLFLMAAMLALPAMMHAQFNFTVDGRQIQVHSFASQGFAYSNQNNFLTMKTSSGSFEFTDGGVNMSTQLTSRFRVGGQMYIRKLGKLGNGVPKLDWAYGDYKFNEWVGIRAGRVKTPLGLYNDTQDIDSLQTFALLPQSIYPMDLRANFIAHTGVDIYGTIPFWKNKVRYAVYAGVRTKDADGGYYYSTATTGIPITHFGGNATGIDLRWDTPLRGLTIGISQVAQTVRVHGSVPAANGAPWFLNDHAPEAITQPYVDYTSGRWHFSGEYRRDKSVDVVSVAGGPVSLTDQGNKGWFTTAAFRVNKRLELGTYYSRFYVDRPATTVYASNHIFDPAVTVRLDLMKHWYAKVEGHFMDGYGDVYSSHGFYPASNPTGLKPKTNMLVVRTGVSF